MRYEYTDLDADRLIIEAPGWPGDTASVSVHGNAVYVPAVEAPKTAQAILDAAGVSAVFLTDLPAVTLNGERYIAGGCSRSSSDPLEEINDTIRGLMAIKLRMEADDKADTKAMADSFNDKLKQAAERIEAENKAAAAKKAHDDLRTSPIALKALALYNEYYEEVDADYASWDEVNSGAGCSDDVVRKYIEQAEREEAKEKEAAEKLAARRDQLVRNHGLALDAHCYNDLDVNGKYLVDRLRIALDEKRDAK